MNTRSGELAATDKLAVDPKLLLDVAMMEDSGSDGGFPNPTSTNESNLCQVLSPANNLMDQFVVPETDPQCQ